MHYKNNILEGPGHETNFDNNIFQGLGLENIGKVLFFQYQALKIKKQLKLAYVRMPAPIALCLRFMHLSAILIASAHSILSALSMIVCVNQSDCI